MKKYIRTEEGIYDLETKNNDGECENQIADIEEISYGGKNGSCVLIPQKCILAEADTIEELCDCYVYCNNGFYEVYRKLDIYHYDEEYLKNGGTIKGAIWTDKGLIYVAKLNGNGELELI